MSACTSHPSSGAPTLTPDTPSAASSTPLTPPASAPIATSSSPTDATTDAPASSSAPTTSSATSTSSGSTPATGGSSAHPPDHSCHANALSLNFGEESGAGGRSYNSYHLTNIGAALCTLAQPQIAYLNSAAAVLKTVSVIGTAAALALRPGGVATLTISDLTTCPSPAAATRLRVTPPTDVTGVSIAVSAGVCAPTATPLTAGAS